MGTGDVAAGMFTAVLGSTLPTPGLAARVLATYDFTRHLQVYAGYSHFFPGEFIRNTGPSRASDFLYGAIQYTF